MFRTCLRAGCYSVILPPGWRRDRSTHPGRCGRITTVCPWTSPPNRSRRSARHHLQRLLHLSRGQPSRRWRLHGYLHRLGDRGRTSRSSASMITTIGTAASRPRCVRCRKSGVSSPRCHCYISCAGRCRRMPARWICRALPGRCARARHRRRSQHPAPVSRHSSVSALAFCECWEPGTLRYEASAPVAHVCVTAADVLIFQVPSPGMRSSVAGGAPARMDSI